jgi:hypothetical protein
MPDTLVQLGSDPFSRETLVRETRREIPRGCDWCGRRRKSWSLYAYGQQSPMGRVNWIRGLFCSVGCMRTYHS